MKYTVCVKPIVLLLNKFDTYLRKSTSNVRKASLIVSIVATLAVYAWKQNIVFSIVTLFFSYVTFYITTINIEGLD